MFSTSCTVYFKKAETKLVRYRESQTLAGQSKGAQRVGKQNHCLVIADSEHSLGTGSLSRQRAPWGAREGLPALLPTGPTAAKLLCQGKPGLSWCTSTRAASTP